MPKRIASYIISPSTWEFIKTALKTRNYHLFDFLHGYFYSRWPYLYIGVATGEHPLSHIYQRLAGGIYELFNRRNSTHGKLQNNYKKRTTLADTYHGKVLPLESAKQLISIKEPIRIGDLEKIIPYPRARDLILENPEKIVALECPCRASRDTPCLPLDVCLIVGEPFASFVADHHPNRSRWISQEEAVRILEEENRRGHVHHAFFKDAMLLRYYAICNCCSCCCGAMQAHQHGVPMLASSGYVARIDDGLCIVCATCQDACNFNAIRVSDHSTIIDEAACMGCGVCVSRCPEGAISLQRSIEKGEPLEVVTLLETTAID